MRITHLLGVLALLSLLANAHAATDYPSGYTKCAQNTGATCSFSSTRSVALGKSGSFVYGTFTNGAVCSSSNFPSNSFTTSAWCSYAGTTTSSSSSVASSASSSRSSSSSSRASSSSSISSSSSSRVSSSISSSSSANTSAYAAVTSQYVYRNITTSNSLYKDSAHFRVYYGTNGKNAGGILGSNSSAEVTKALDFLEAAFDYWMTQRGFRSPGLPVNGHSGGPFKMNVYSITDLQDAAGVMGYDDNAGLPYLIVLTSQLGYPEVYVHEFGHCITLSEYLWVNKGNTGAWWETLAQWHTDTFLAFAQQHATVAAKYGDPSYSTIIDVNTVISQSYLTLVHTSNLYEAWPFFSYLSANPDGISGLGVNAVRTMYRSYQGTETPLHTIARMTSSTTWQRVVGMYWARMAYIDINHSLAQQRLFANINNSAFRSNSYRNLSSVGNNTYRVISSRKPMYGGANINPLTVTGGGSVTFAVKNLGNGLSDSNYTAVVAIRNTSSNAVRYVLLSGGAGSVTIASGEEASLVVSNTPNSLYTFDAFSSTSSSPDRIGLNYEVVITGAKPRDL